MAWAWPRRRSTPDAAARYCSAGPQSRRVENPHEVRGFAVTSRGPLKSEDVLSRLVLEARQDLQRRRHLMGSDQLELAVAAYTPRDFIGALRKPGLAVIAEMKQRTPSMGVLAEDYRPADIAHAYTDGGASAISVLTHMAGFGVLRKDFTVSEADVCDARLMGADAVLLIVAALADAELVRFRALADELGLAALVEVHDEAETHAALEADAHAIGVNHRNLRDFSIDLGLTERLRKLVPENVVLVAESGIHTPADARRLREAGADAILVGEALMRSADPAAQISELLG
ncbi:MAG: indole-3-glycerol-phosphate synthase [Chloroflexi bacterium]|nr:MAG: indole-3-glycerol-phosphate synthase [Chloroflexota bacterium]